jgi:hypothetical protein
MKSKYAEQNEVRIDDEGTAHWDFWYPPRSDEENPEDVCALQVGLVDVRAADDIRITFEFERDGWVIAQRPFTHNKENGATKYKDRWQEVAFIQAWALEEKS